MQLMSANRVQRATDTGPVTELSVDFQDDNGELVNNTIPDTSTRYHRVLELVTTVVNAQQYSDEDVESAYEELASLLDVFRAVQRGVETISSQTDGVFTVDRRASGGVLYNGQALPRAVSSHILRIVDNDERGNDTYSDWNAFAQFVENLYKNVRPYVREQLYGWLESLVSTAGGFTLTEDGCLIAYKGCANGTEETPVSQFSGHAFVVTNPDNADRTVTEYRGQPIPYAVGTDVFMPENEVEDDPSVGCAAGLHAATLDFARGFTRGVNLLMLKIDPKDLVSVPVECDAQKVRVSKLRVLQYMEELHRTPTYHDSDDDDEEWDDDGECPECGTELDDDGFGEYCPECDEAESRCAHCDEVLDEPDDYCASCSHEDSGGRHRAADGSYNNSSGVYAPRHAAS